MDLFEGNKAETKTLIPVLTGFADRHQVGDLVVVADAGMLSAANLLALEDNGFRFIVGSKTSSPVRLGRPCGKAWQLPARRADHRDDPEYGYREERS